MPVIAKKLFAALLSVGFIVLLDLLILVPIVTGGVAVAHDLASSANNHEAMEILNGIGVILIGWGVALEQRHTLRAMSDLVGGPDENRQCHLDYLCHSVGIGLLLLGLFAEICVEAVKIPDYIINTAGKESVLLSCGWALMMIAGIALAVHVIRLGWFVLNGHRTAPDLSNQLR